MGCGGSHATKTKESEAIDQILKQEARKEAKSFKVLLLGAGDSGKSTFIKQMVLLHFGSFSDLESRKALLSIHENMIVGIKSLTMAVPADKFSSKAKKSYTFVSSQSTDTAQFDVQEWAPHIPVIWECPAVKEAYKKQHELKLDLSCGIDYFFNNAEAVLTPDYKPSVDDVLRARTKTTGIQEYIFNLEEHGVTIKIVDVGGQRCERRKWMHQFDNVNLVVYFSSLTGYAMKMEEEGTTNRLMDDLALFNSLMSLIPNKKSWVFLQNKCDLFKDMIKTNGLDKVFTNLPADKANDYDYCIKFLEGKFQEKWTGEKLTFFVTCALDADQMKLIWTTLHKDLVRNQIGYGI